MNVGGPDEALPRRARMASWLVSGRLIVASHFGCRLDCCVAFAGESFYLRVYGKLNHNLRCTLRGYRNLMGDFTGNTIYTGYVHSIAWL